MREQVSEIGIGAKLKSRDQGLRRAFVSLQCQHTQRELTVSFCLAGLLLNLPASERTCADRERLGERSRADLKISEIDACQRSVPESNGSPRIVLRSSRIRPANDRETSRNGGNGWSIESAGQEPDSAIAAGSEIDHENTLKVERRVRTPLGLRTEDPRSGH